MKTQSDVLAQAKRWFGGEPYIINSLDKLFLVLADPKESKGKWTKNGKPVTFTYMERRCVANGDTPKELLASLRKYRLLCRLDKSKAKPIAKFKRLMRIMRLEPA